MRKNVQTFTYGVHTLRVTQIQGEPWFVVKDVGRIIGLSKPRDALMRLPSSDKSLCQIRTAGGPQKMQIINERGLWVLIYRRRWSFTKSLEAWLRSEVLPALHNQPSNQAPVAKAPTVQGAPEITHPIQHAEEKPMSAISLFNFDGSDVRIVDQNGNPWFVAKDVCDVLGYANSRKAIADHCKKARRIKSNDSLHSQDIGVSSFQEELHVVDERNVHPLHPHTIIIPESDVYRLIMRSKLPAAERFEEWVTSEVLPAIRKTGSYSLDRQAYLREALHDVPSLQFLVHECTVKIQELQDEVAENQPKIEVYHRIAHADGSLCLTDAAKALQVAPNDLITWMADNRWIYKRTPRSAWVGYQRQMNRGLLEHKVVEVSSSRQGLVEIGGQVRVTPQGLDVISQRMND